MEIIPNWHPIFVHFTVALFSTAVFLFFLAYVTSYTKLKSISFFSEIEIVARWCLWLSAVFSIITVSFGFYAYYTVKHDAISHAAMTTHRNWALITASIIVLSTLWSVWRHYKKIKLTLTFLLVILIGEGLLVTTAWHGGEVVYRYGIGVMSLPKVEKVGHQHSHNPKDSQQSGQHTLNHDE